ncbi:unnamed protein product [Lactuca virosa]|uniref:Dolichyl-diphosphooligosaccharide--protein glycosyltransferase subunit 4 n=1 Tax=Lactuca virosa TaxID=75947 RepID=A0AAU9NL16_9ASTR|nr:unnamed protein product [Lactuca virosa]
MDQKCENNFRPIKTRSLNRLKSIFQFPFCSTDKASKMITDSDLGFIANFLGIFIFALVIAYHYVLADPKYEGN